MSHTKEWVLLGTQFDNVYILRLNNVSFYLNLIHIYRIFCLKLLHFCFLYKILCLWSITIVTDLSCCMGKKGKERFEFAISSLCRWRRVSATLQDQCSKECSTTRSGDAWCSSGQGVWTVDCKVGLINDHVWQDKTRQNYK